MGMCVFWKGGEGRLKNQSWAPVSRDGVRLAALWKEKGQIESEFLRNVVP